jgi:hypothetical protein
MQDLAGAADMYGPGPGASYGHLRGPPGLPPQAAAAAMLLPGHPHHHAMMMAHHAAASVGAAGHVAHHHPGMYGLPGGPVQSPAGLHAGMESLGHIQDIHAR